jgi:hypothetical protein
MAFAWRRSLAIVAGMLLFVAVWLSSIGYTAAGFSYSMRVLSPAILLAAVIGGGACARFVPAKKYLAGAVLAGCLFAVDASLRALVSPANVYKLPPTIWFTYGGILRDEYAERPLYRQIVHTVAGKRILVLGPNSLLTTLGAETAPLWSPEFSYLFAKGVPAKEVARRLAAAKVGFILLTRGSANATYLSHSPYFGAPGGTLAQVWSDDDLLLLRVQSP